MTKLFILIFTIIFASQYAKAQQNSIRCGTAEPGTDWDAWFNQRVVDFQQNHSTRSVTNYTIPVIVHVISAGEAVGSGKNISTAQINSQIDVLNADYAGTGYNVGNLPGAFSGLVANTGIQFCMALKDPNGATLAEPGIDRITDVDKGFTSSNTGYSQTYINATIKPNTIWDPAKYLNIWVLNVTGGLLGYATFPGGTSLSGLSGTGTATTDGVVLLFSVFGNTGNVTAPFNLGRTATHEISHWLGLRHIWGDASCGDDYCNDTPAQSAANYGCPTFPNNANVCSGSTNGDMFMNFLDYSDDACMYMFTPDQTIRIQTAMQTGTYRMSLGTHGVCSSGPVASFTSSAASVCANQGVSFTNTSVGASAYSWYIDGVMMATTANFSYNFVTPGTPAIMLVASDSAGIADTAIASINVFASPSANAGADQTICSGTSVMLNAMGGITYLWSPGNQTSSAISVSPSSNTNYTVTVTDANGCVNSDNVTVIVNPIPAVNAGADQSVCLGNSLTLSGSGAQNYVWDNGITNGIAFTLSSTTAFTVTGTDANGCSNTDIVTVNVNPLPLVSFSGNGNCVNTPINFTNNTGIAGGSIISYAWDFGNGTSSMLLNPVALYSTSGTYNVSLSAVSDMGCVGAYNTSFDINAVPVIQGAVTYDSAGTILPVVNGTITLFSLDTNKQVVSFASQSYTNGNYSFNNYTATGNYALLSAPDSALYFPNVVPQYHNGTTVWDSLTTLQVNCGDTLTKTIKHKYLPSDMGGTGTISGFVYSPYGRRPGEPVIGIDISVEQIPGGMQAMRTTDTTGYYEFNNVPDGTYVLLVNIPGKDMDSTYTITINSTTGDILDTNKVFFVDSTSIFISDSILVVTGFKSGENISRVTTNVIVYPNPVVTVSTLLIESEEPVRIEMINSSGVLLSVADKIKPQTGICKFSVDKEKLNMLAGVYYFRITTTRETKVVKVICR